MADRRAVPPRSVQPAGQPGLLGRRLRARAECVVGLQRPEQAAELRTRAEYLADFVKSGGSAVKFAVPPDDGQLGALLRDVALAEAVLVLATLGSDSLVTVSVRVAVRAAPSDAVA